MLTAEQEKTLVELGFKKSKHIDCPNYQKHYRVLGIIYVFYNDDNMVAQKNVYTCKEAKHDLAVLREKGIV